MQRLPRVTSWSCGEVTLTIASSCTCSVEVAADAAVRADGVDLRLLRLVPRAGLRAARTRSSTSARRSGRRRCSCRSRRTPTPGSVTSNSVEMCALEAAAGDGDRERVLVVDAAGLDALVTEDALRVVAHVEVVVDLHRLRDGRRVWAEALGLRAVLARCSASASGAVERSTDEPSSSSTSRRLVRTRSRVGVHDHARPRPCASRRARACARPRPRRRRRGRRSPASACRRSRASACRCRACGRRRGSSSPRARARPGRRPSARRCASARRRLDQRHRRALRG